MASVNKVILVGNLGQDPELRYTQQQTAVVTLNLATSEHREVNGQPSEVTTWHRIVVWGKLAENCQKYLAKGRPIYVEGRLQTRTWEKDGQKHYTTEIVAQNIQFLGGAPRQEGQQSQTASPLPPAQTDNTVSNQWPANEDIPF